MSEPTVYTFTDKSDYTQTTATNPSSDQLTITITSSFAVGIPGKEKRSLDRTTIKCPNGEQATINWSQDSFEIDGERLNVEDVRSWDKSSLYSRQWAYNKSSYEVKYEYGAKYWHVRRITGSTNTQTPQALIEFHLYQSKLIGPSIPATISINIPSSSSSASSSDLPFLLSILIYSEITLHPPISLGGKLTKNLGDNIARGIIAALMGAGPTVT